MSHEHRHHHDHHHESTIPFEEKLIKRIDHWLQHNTDHAESYREWSEKLGQEGWPEAAALLAEAATESLRINRLFEKALDSVRAKGA